MGYTRGFTLVELLVSLAVVAVLSLVVILAVNPAEQRKKARDARRLSDMQSIMKAISLYSVQTGDGNLQMTSEYGESESVNGGYDTSNIDNDGDGDPFIEFLQPYFGGGAPIDPVNDPAHKYLFFVYSAGSYGCSAAKGKFYVLMVRDMEMSANPHPKSPGWSCPTRNWQTEGDWVAGAFVGN
jgi:prepilin-type N-terminal cleavage/methylation domain-containing protein